MEYTKDPDPSEGEEGAPFFMLWELTCELGHKSDFWEMLYLSNVYDHANWFLRYLYEGPIDDGDEDDDDSDQQHGGFAAEMLCPSDNDKVMWESS